jgi:hypothetical protein
MVGFCCFGGGNAPLTEALSEYRRKTLGKKNAIGRNHPWVVSADFNEIT